MCYTFGDRGWLKGVVRGRNKRFQSTTEQADSASSRTRSPGVCVRRICLFGCRWCGETEGHSEMQPWNGAASPGEPKGYQVPSRRSNASIVTLGMQSSSVSEDPLDRSGGFLQWPCLRICENGWCPTPQCKKSSLCRFQNRFQFHPTRRRSLPGIHRLRRRFSFFCG